MFKQRVKHFVATLFGLLGAAIFICGVVYVYTYLPVPKHTDDDPVASIQSIVYADDPAMLYRTVGIRNCDEDFPRKLDRSMVTISSDDLARAKPLLQRQFTGEITAALYTNAPEGTKELRGIPAIILLRKEGATFCALGTAGTYSTPLFLEIEAKYQPMLNQQ